MFLDSVYKVCEIELERKKVYPVVFENLMVERGSERSGFECFSCFTRRAAERAGNQKKSCDYVNNTSI